MNKQTLQVDVIETTIYNEKPELRKLECNGCGGNLNIVDNTHAICPHCGRTYEINHAENVKIDVTVDSEGREQTRSMVTKTIIVLGVVLVIAVLAIIAIIAYNIHMRSL